MLTARSGGRTHRTEGTSGLRSREPRRAGPRPVAAVIRQLGETFLAASESGRLPNPRELRVFRVLGARCGLGGPDCDEILETLEAAAEAIHIQVLTHATRHDRTVGEDAALSVGASLCGVIETLSRLVYDEVVLGFETAHFWQPHDPATVTAFTRLLDAPADVADAVTAPGTCDVRVPRAVAALMTRGSDAGAALQAACQEIEVLVPQSLALRWPSAWPPHARVVIEYRSRTDWRLGRALIGSVADVHDLSVVTTDPVIGLGRLRERYRRLRDALTALADDPPDGGGPSPAAPGLQRPGQEAPLVAALATSA